MQELPGGAPAPFACGGINGVAEGGKKRGAEVGCLVKVFLLFSVSRGGGQGGEASPLAEQSEQFLPRDGGGPSWVWNVSPPALQSFI